MSGFASRARSLVLASYVSSPRCLPVLLWFKSVSRPPVGLFSLKDQIKRLGKGWGERAGQRGDHVSEWKKSVHSPCGPIRRTD